MLCFNWCQCEVAGFQQHIWPSWHPPHTSPSHPITLQHHQHPTLNFPWLSPANSHIKTNTNWAAKISGSMIFVSVWREPDKMVQLQWRWLGQVRIYHFSNWLRLERRVLLKLGLEQNGLESVPVSLKSFLDVPWVWVVLWKCFIVDLSCRAVATG